MKGESDLIEYVAEWINTLPPHHRVHRAFKYRLKYSGEEMYVDPENNVFLFNFPMSSDDDTSEAAEAIGISPDIVASNAPAVAIVPVHGEYPLQAMNAWNPYFNIICRHHLPGCAFRCLYYLMLELNNNASVFPQNGVVFALHSQPVTVWNDRRGLSVYQASFRVLAAEPIV
jgi:hypothetical protein